MQRFPYVLLSCVLLFSFLVTACAGAGGASITGPTASNVVTPTVVGTGLTTLTYTKDIQPILASDCVSCHGPSIQNAGLNLSSYAGVLRVVTAGNAGSLLIQVTQPSGVMASALTGNRTLKMQTIYDWVMTSKAAQ